MPPEDSAARGLDSAPCAPSDNLGFWFELIDEREAAVFLDLTERTLQKWRQAGSGPKFIRLSARCIKYRRINLREHAEERLVTSTADPGKAGA